MGSYQQFCPVAKASEIFAERWTPLILRELLMGSERFNELESGLPRISRSLLTARLRSLEQAGLIDCERGRGGRVSRYRLTSSGRELAEVVGLLGEWGQRWLEREIDPEDIDPMLLMWDMHRRIDLERLPEGRVVVEIHFTGAVDQRFWLILDRGGASVCYEHPGFEADVLVTADTEALHRVWVGWLSFESAVRHRLISIEGPSELTQAFPGWLKLSVFAGIRPAAEASNHWRRLVTAARS